MQVPLTIRGESDEQQEERWRGEQLREAGTGQTEAQAQLRARSLPSAHCGCCCESDQADSSRACSLAQAVAQTHSQCVWSQWCVCAVGGLSCDRRREGGWRTRRIWARTARDRSCAVYAPFREQRGRGGEGRPFVLPHLSSRSCLASLRGRCVPSCRRCSSPLSFVLRPVRSVRCATTRRRSRRSPLLSIVNPLWPMSPPCSLYSRAVEAHALRAALPLLPHSTSLAAWLSRRAVGATVDRALRTPRHWISKRRGTAEPHSHRPFVCALSADPM